MVSLSAIANDEDGEIESTAWLVNGTEVATGLSATIALSDGSTVVTFKAMDDDGASSTAKVTITISAPTYTATKEWPSPYNGVTPSSSLNLSTNNIGIFNSNDSIIYTCLGLYTDGFQSSSNGISQFDIGLEVVSLGDATVRIVKFREFNEVDALNENEEMPDCSGKFETKTGVFSDIIKAGTSILDTSWSLIDSGNLILKLMSSKELNKS